MRIALPSLLVAALAYACSTFSDAAEPTPPPAVDSGTDGGGGSAGCAPEVVDPSSPQTCTADFASDPTNCGTRRHACIDTTCLEGRCVAERVTDVERNASPWTGRGSTSPSATTSNART